MRLIFYMFFFISIIFFVSCGVNENSKTNNRDLVVKSWAYQLQNIDIDQIARSKFDLVVIDYSKDGMKNSLFSKTDIDKLKANHIVLSYLSIGEAENYRFYWKEEWNNNKPSWIKDQNNEWKGNYAVEYWNNVWKDILYKYIDKIIEQGFNGLYLDKVDEFEYFSNKGMDRREAALRMIDLIKDLSHYARSKVDNFYIFIQNGENIIEYDDKLLDIINGFGIEDLFYNGLELNDKQYIKEREIYLNKAINKDKIILSVDYVDDSTKNRENIDRIIDYRNRALNHNYIPYAAVYDRELDELNIIENIQP